MTNVSNIRMAPMFIPSDNGLINANLITRIIPDTWGGKPVIQYMKLDSGDVDCSAQISQETLEQLTEGKSLDIEA